MKHATLIEIGGSAATLGVSLWLAFGPLRHRLPRFITRFARCSAALKLVASAGVCGWLLWQNVEHDGSRALRWGLTVSGVVLVYLAVWVLRRGVRSGPTRPEDRP
jgi:hypothetical protein